jgi:VWFA-related protein
MIGLAVAVAVSVVPPQLPPIRDPHIFRAATNLVSVTVTVRNHEGRLVSKLPREAFDIREDGEPQTITQFTNERVPVSLALLLDTSDSMFGARLKDAREAVERFFGDLLDPADEFAIAIFNHRTRIMLNWGQSLEEARTTLERIKSSGSTALYDAILAVLPLADVRHRERVAFLVISDGADTASDARLRDVRTALNRSEAFVYALAIDSPDRRAINIAVDPVALAEITDQSGGRTETVHTTGALLEALTRIAEELNNQYVVGYTSPKGADERYHTIRVRIRDHPDYRVQARRGYVAAGSGRPAERP